MKKNTENPGYLTPALDKGLDILELMASESAGLTKAEIARRLNRTYSEIFRMLVCLERRGYISHPDGDDYFQLTMKLFQMAQTHPPSKRLIEEALPQMRRSAQIMSQSCHLAVVDDGQVIVIAQADPPSTLGFYVRAGTAVDLMRAASGYVCLAFQSEDARLRTIHRWQERTNGEIPGDLDKHLQHICEVGYEECPSYEVRGVVNCSFPIMDTHGRAVAALTVPYIERVDRSSTLEKVRFELRHAAAHITDAIGGRALQRNHALQNGSR